MAVYTATTAKSFPTTAGAMDTTTLSSPGAVVRITHRGTADPIYFTLGPNTALTPAVTIEGDNCGVVMPGQTTDATWPVTAPGARVVVRTICASAQGCTIQVQTARPF